MAITFDISTGNPVVFTSPSITVEFTDTTPALCGVSAWDWSFNSTTVSNTSSWTHTFFGAQESEMILEVGTSTYLATASEPVTFIIEPAWPTYPSFRILPSSNFNFESGSGVAAITAQNTSPVNMTGVQYLSALTYLSGMVLGSPAITGTSVTEGLEVVTASADSYQWYFNGVAIDTTRDWDYQFFDPITGLIYSDMTSMAFTGSAYTTNSTEFSGEPTIWQTLSSVPTYTGVPGLCSLPEQQLIINETADFPSCDDVEPVAPAGVKASTTLSPVVTSYELLSERIKMQLGWPMTNIELCEDQIMDFINQGCEWYSKYAGFTEEIVMFNSERYQCGYGLKMDDMFNNITDFYCPFSTAGNMVSGQYVDCDTNNYRKVVGIFSVDPAGGSGGGTEILFNMDYMFAQQAYFGAMMGGFGYDITTWHMLKEWMDLRKKMFATQVYVNFNPTTQLLKLTPEPQTGFTSGRGQYIGVVGCRLEKSVKELVQERWVQRYALALAKISLAHIRGKFGGVTLFGGGQVNATDLMTQGLEERKTLEEELMNGFGEAEPPLFFIE
tara:strand:- start:1212 stop:2876 length:1665 start_codon:yes stop_codon:yes gene_type:complete